MNFHVFKKRISFSQKFRASFDRARLYSTAGPWAVFNIIVVGVSLGFFVLGTAAMFGWALLSYLHGDKEALAVTVLMAILCIAMFWLIVYAIDLTGKHIVIMQQFAADNNLTFHPWVKVDDSHGFAFTVKRRRFSRNAVTGTVSGRTFWLHEYRFLSGTGRHPYPNIFTVFLIHLDKSYQQSVFINKKGRLKILWPRIGIKKADSPWYDTIQLQLYTEDGSVDRAVSQLLTKEKIQQILAINEKAEIEIKDRSLRIFLPGKPVPTKEEAEKLFDFAKQL